VIDIYTDGACSGNPGPGGWGAIVIIDGQQTVLKGGLGETTNNRMEMMAVIEGLRYLPSKSIVTIHTDSTYITNTMTKGWRRKANLDLWQEIDDLVDKQSVTWKWVKGHAGNPLNELADSIAFKESQSRITKNKGKIEENPTLFDETLSHVDQTGNASMVDVGAKSSTFRVAKAEGWVHMKPATLNLIKENSIGKGDVLSVAKVAGIMASKKTSDLIPLCHPIPVDKVSVEILIDESKNAIHVVSEASTHSKTGIEMEALIAVSISCLTIYDMCKSAERTIKIDGIRLLKKTGGKHTYNI
jgi:cyclic pyranopterin phosphate synthase|tara:strand:+ start:2267 stop:3166 length:900 start_codon:yes stop_codon:yes gene_type:complete